jgi:fibronectin-binding autotransporter adhesin
VSSGAGTGVNDGQVSGVITGGNFIKTGSGIFVLKGSNTYTGATTIGAGTLQLGSTNSIPSGTSLTVTGTLDLGGFSQTVNVLSGTGLISSSGSGTLVLTVSQGGYSGVIENGTASSVGLTKTSTNTLTLSGSSSYTGPTLVNQGILTVGHSNGLGVSSLTTVSDGASLWLQGGISIGALPLSLRGQGFNSAGALLNFSGTNSWAGTVTLVSATTRINSDAGVLTLGGSSSISSNNISLQVGSSGEVVVSGAISLGSGTLTKDGGGRLTLAGVNVYSGVTSVNNGTLRLANSSGLGSSSMTTVSNGATVELIGGVSVSNALTLSGPGMSNGGALRNVSGDNSWTGTLVVGSTATYINSDSGVLDITGVISGNTAARGVRYGGAGTVKVSGTSTYTGVSEISTGATLLLGNTNVLSSSSNVLFSGGKLLSDGKSVSVGTLSVSSASELVLGTGSHAVRFSGPGTFSFTRLVIKGWEGVYSGSGSAGTAGQFFVGTSAVLTREQLDQIQFVDANNVSYYAVQLGTGEVVPGVGTLANPTGNSNVQVTNTTTSGGSWTTTGSGSSTLHTFTPSADNANINASDITTRLQGGSGITQGSVKIVTTNTGVGTQVGNVNFVASVSAQNSSLSRFSLQVVSGGDIVVGSSMSVTGGTWDQSSNYGYDVSLSAGGHVITTGSINTSGQSANACCGSVVRSNGGNVTISAGGYVRVGGGITTSGGTNSGGSTSSMGGTVSITGPGGVTLTGGITASGNASSGVITINNGNGTVSSGAGTGVNDGQVSGVITGGNFIKTGSGIFVLKGSNTYSGTTTVTSGTLRLGASNSIPTTSGLVLAGGEFQSAGFGNTFASITLSANSTLRLGSGVHTLTFTNLGSFTSGRILTIEDWQGNYASPGTTGTAGRIVFTPTTSATILGQLKFNNSSTGNLHTSIQLGTKEIVAGNQ